LTLEVFIMNLGFSPPASTSVEQGHDFFITWRIDVFFFFI